MIDIDKVKQTWAEGEAESTFEDLDNVYGHLIAYFKSQIEDMNKEEFIEYLKYELGYDEDMISDMFSESEFVNKMYAESE
jgi:hypothetical protein|tara:strand:- start:1088 stop:1327 length:240 start_codon:yes stop_codon:yes gene_type:complete